MNAILQNYFFSLASLYSDALTKGLSITPYHQFIIPILLCHPVGVLSVPSPIGL